MKKSIAAAFDRRIAEIRQEERKLADALKLLEQIDFSICSSLTRVYDAMPWQDMERASGCRRDRD